MAFRALMVIADIGGYTRFMRVHRINLAHAQYIVGRTVPVAEYVLMSEEVNAAITAAGVEGDPSEVDEELEGLGRVRTFYLELDGLGALTAPPPVRAPVAARLWRWLRMTLRSLPYFLGAREACRGFRHLGEITGAQAPAELPQATARE